MQTQGERQHGEVTRRRPALTSKVSFRRQQNWNDRVCVSVRESVCVGVYVCVCECERVRVSLYVCECVNVCVGVKIRMCM